MAVVAKRRLQRLAQLCLTFPLWLSLIILIYYRWCYSLSHWLHVSTLWINQTVFNELHYGRYAGLYQKQTFFFDSHPPLGKQLLALAGYLGGFQGSNMTLFFHSLREPYNNLSAYLFFRFKQIKNGHVTDRKLVHNHNDVSPKNFT